jgi:hypothetical protein
VQARGEISRNLRIFCLQPPDDIPKQRLTEAGRRGDAVRTDAVMAKAGKIWE